MLCLACCRSPEVAFLKPPVAEKSGPREPAAGSTVCPNNWGKTTDETSRGTNVALGAARAERGESEGPQ